MTIQRISLAFILTIGLFNRALAEKPSNYEELLMALQTKTAQCNAEVEANKQKLKAMEKEMLIKTMKLATDFIEKCEKSQHCDKNQLQELIALCAKNNKETHYE